MFDFYPGLPHIVHNHNISWSLYCWLWNLLRRSCVGRWTILQLILSELVVYWWYFRDGFWPMTKHIPQSYMSLTHLEGGLCMHPLHNEELVVLTTEWLPWYLTNCVKRQLLRGSSSDKLEDLLGHYNFTLFPGCLLKKGESPERG